MVSPAHRSRSSTSRRSRHALRRNCGGGSMPCWRTASSSSAPKSPNWKPQLAAFCGAKHCVVVSSGTDALQIAMMAEGIGHGDAVFLPAFTYTATAEVPLVLGATPVFVDVDPRTFQMDPAHLERRIAEVRRAGKLRPRAVIGVDLFGQPADWPALRAIAQREDLFTLDDLAQSFGCHITVTRSARQRTPPRPASSRPSRSAPTATPVRCSRKATGARSCIAACARTARARRATRCCTPA